MGPEPDEERPQCSARAVPTRAGQALRAPTQAEQRTARIMGAWFLGTVVFSIPALQDWGLPTGWKPTGGPVPLAPVGWSPWLPAQ